MRRYKNIFITVGILVIVAALGVTARVAFLKDHTASTKITSTNPCVFGHGPNGSIAQVCPEVIIPRMAPLSVTQTPIFLNRMNPLLVSAGTGTTTLKKETPFNDILIAESASPYAGLRNARYTMWPYPGEIQFKEVYLVLPDSYAPLFSGYSNNQFAEIDGVKNIILYVRRGSSTGTGADARILIGSPTATDEKDHAPKLFDSTDSWEGFSVVSKGQEVVVEIILTPTGGTSSEVQNIVRTELAHVVEGMEIIW